MRSGFVIVMLAAAIGAAVTAGVIVARGASRAAKPVLAAPARRTLPPVARLMVPSLRGVRLDQASMTLASDHLARKIDGGGVFGVLDDTNWVVCSTTPPASFPVVAGSVVVVHVQRTC